MRELGTRDVDSTVMSVHRQGSRGKDSVLMWGVISAHKQQLSVPREQRILRGGTVCAKTQNSERISGGLMDHIKHKAEIDYEI